MTRLLLPPMVALLLGTACGGIEKKLAAGDGVWQITQYSIRISDGATGAVRLDETLADAGQITFVTEYDDWGGQFAILELPTARPNYPSGAYYGADAPPTELLPNSRYVLWDYNDQTLDFAWGASWSEPEEIPLEPDGDGYSGSSTLTFSYGIADTETWEQTYVLVP